MNKVKYAPWHGHDQQPTGAWRIYDNDLMSIEVSYVDWALPDERFTYWVEEGDVRFYYENPAD